METVTLVNLLLVGVFFSLLSLWIAYKVRAFDRKYGGRAGD
jgi:hypothetical protein